MRRTISLLLLLPAALGLSPMFEAVASNNPTAVRAALADGANVNELGEKQKP